LALSPLVNFERRCLQQHLLLVAALMHGQAVFIGHAVFEGGVFSADAAGLSIFSKCQHDELAFTEIFFREELTKR
jgi:hypothetical protein